MSVLVFHTTRAGYESTPLLLPLLLLLSSSTLGHAGPLLKILSDSSTHARTRPATGRKSRAIPHSLSAHALSLACLFWRFSADGGRSLFSSSFWSLICTPSPFGMCAVPAAPVRIIRPLSSIIGLFYRAPLVLQRSAPCHKLCIYSNSSYKLLRCCALRVNCGGRGGRGPFRLTISALLLLLLLLLLSLCFSQRRGVGRRSRSDEASEVHVSNCLSDLLALEPLSNARAQTRSARFMGISSIWVE